MYVHVTLLCSWIGNDHITILGKLLLRKCLNSISSFESSWQIMWQPLTQQAGLLTLPKFQE
jgi:hypothetical protein